MKGQGEVVANGGARSREGGGKWRCKVKGRWWQKAVKGQGKVVAKGGERSREGGGKRQWKVKGRRWQKAVQGQGEAVAKEWNGPSAEPVVDLL